MMPFFGCASFSACAICKVARNLVRIAGLILFLLTASTCALVRAHMNRVSNNNVNIVKFLIWKSNRLIYRLFRER